MPPKKDALPFQLDVRDTGAPTPPSPKDTRTGWDYDRMNSALNVVFIMDTVVDALDTIKDELNEVLTDMPELSHRAYVLLSEARDVAQGALRAHDEMKARAEKRPYNL